MISIYKYSQRSESRLHTCHDDLIRLAYYSLIDCPYDIAITHGQRTPEEQFELYKQGRSLHNGKWTITDYSKLVTNCDGYHIKSNHNYTPSRAFDIMIYVNGTGTWQSQYYEEVAQHILHIANMLSLNNIISSVIRWGGTFTNYDGPHFEIIQSGIRGKSPDDLSAFY